MALREAADRFGDRLHTGVSVQRLMRAILIVARVGLALHERPIFSRLNSLEHPIELQEGMVFALETYCPADDGHSAARIEEEIVVTADGPQLLTLFPAEELFVANRY